MMLQRVSDTSMQPGEQQMRIRQRLKGIRGGVDGNSDMKGPFGALQQAGRQPRSGILPLPEGAVNACCYSTRGAAATTLSRGDGLPGIPVALPHDQFICRCLLRGFASRLAMPTGIFQW